MTYQTTSITTIVSFNGKFALGGADERNGNNGRNGMSTILS